MAKFTWKSLTLIVTEMSRTTALEFAKEAELIQLINDFDVLTREVDYLITRYAPVKVLCDGKVLSEGTHVIDIGDDETINLVLPITRENFNQLPVSLAAEWSNIAESENTLVTAFFEDTVKKIAKNFSELKPAPAQ